MANQLVSGVQSFDGSQRSYRSHLEDLDAGPEQFEQELAASLDFMKKNGKVNSNVLNFLMP